MTATAIHQSGQVSVQVPVEDAMGVLKKVHYALVCYSPISLVERQPGGQLYARALRNLLSGNPVGASQVTAVVRTEPSQFGQGRPYEIALSAQLVPPYFVRLLEPVPIADPTNLNSRCLGRPWRDVVDTYGSVAWPT